MYDNDYAFIYKLALLLPTNLATLYINGWIDKDYWFMNDQQIRQTRRLMDDFIEIGQLSEIFGSSFCFAILLGQEETGVDPFKLSLLKHGDTIVDTYKLPMVLDFEVVTEQSSDVKFKVYYEGVWSLSSDSSDFKYDLLMIYSTLDKFVST